LPDHPGRLIAGVPHLVGCASGNVEDLAGTKVALLATDLRPQGAVEDLEVLVLRRVIVSRRRLAPGP
jgi:hypothetical protein